MARESQAGCWLHLEVLWRELCKLCHLLLDGDRVPVEGVWEGLVIQHIIALDALRVVQQRHQVLDVSAGETERVDLRELPIGRISWHELPELVEGRVDGVHTFSLPAVGRHSLHLALQTTGHRGVVVAVRLDAVSTVGAAAPGASGRAVRVRLVPVRVLSGAGAGPFGAGEVFELL